MATGASNVARSSSSADRVDSHQQFIQRQLSRTRRHVKVVELCSSLMLWAVSALALVMLVALLDHWIAPLGFWGRLVILAALVSGSVWFLLTQLGPLLLRRINPAYAARAIEQAVPTLKNSLINFLMFRTDASRTSHLVHQALSQQAAADLAHIPVEQTVDRSKLIRIGYLLVTITAIVALYSVLSPKSTWQTLQRVANPWAAIDRPTRVSIRNVEPGDQRVHFGQHVTVVAEVQGMSDDGEVVVVYDTQDRQIVGRRLPMKQRGSWQYELTLPDNAQGFQQSITYYIQAGDATAGPFDLTMVPAPTIIVDRLEYQYPKYTGRGDHVERGRGDISGIEGTLVTVIARANQPIRSASIELNPDSESKERLSMRSDGQQASYTFPLLLADDGKPKYHGYQLHFTDQQDNDSGRPVRHRIEVIPDLAPEIQILIPSTDLVELPANRSQRIQIRALDPDFGLSKVMLRAVSGGRSVVDEALLEFPQGQLGQYLAEYDLRPDQLGLVAGSEVIVWGVAEDNRRLDFRSEGEPNSSRTRNYRIVIIDPLEQPADPQAADQPEPNSDPSNPANKPSGAEPEGAPADQDNRDDPPSASPSPDPKQGDASATKTPDNAPGNNKDPKDPQDPSTDRQPMGDPNQGEAQPADSQQGSGSESQAAQQPADSTESNPTDSQQSPSEGGGNATEGGTSQAAGQPSENGDPNASQQGTAGQQTTGDQTAGDQTSGQQTSGQQTAGQQSTGQQSTGQQGSDQRETNSAQSPNGDRQGERYGPSDGSSQPREKLHDGEAFEKALQYLKEKQQSTETQQEPGGGESGSNSDAGGEQSNGTDGNPEPGQQLDPNQGANDDSSKPPSDNENPQGAEEAGSQQPGDAASKDAATAPSGASPEAGDAQPGGSHAAQQSSAQDTAGQSQPTNPDAASADTTGDDAQSPGGQGDQAQKDPSGTQKDQTGQGADGRSEQQQSGAGDDATSGEGDPSGDQEGSPEAQGKNKDTNKQPDGSSPSQSSPGGPKSPSQSERQSDTGGESQGDRSGAGEQGGGQGANQAGNDSAGSNSVGDQGGATADESGTTETSDQAGNKQQSDSATGQSGQQPGAASQGGSAGESGSPQASDSSGTQGSSAGNQPSGGGGIHEGQGGRQTAIGPADELNLQYARKATDLVLEELSEEQPDRELLDRLGWTPEQLRDFLDRWKQLKQAARQEGGEAERQLDQQLKSLGLRPSGDQRRKASDQSDTVRGLSDDGARTAPPARFRDQFEAYKRSSGRQNPDQ